MLNKILICSVIVMVMGCSPAGKLRRAERLIASAIENGAKVSRDTVYVTKEIFVPKREADSTIYFRDLRDTIYLTKDKIITKVKVDTRLKTIYVNTKCVADTIKIKVPVEVTREIKAGSTWWDIVKICILVAVVSILLTILFYNRRR